MVVAEANYRQFSIHQKASKKKNTNQNSCMKHERWKLNLPHVCLLPRNHLKSRYAQKAFEGQSCIMEKFSFFIASLLRVSRTIFAIQPLKRHSRWNYISANPFCCSFIGALVKRAMTSTIFQQFKQMRGKNFRLNCLCCRNFNFYLKEFFVREKKSPKKISNECKMKPTTTSDVN